MVNNQFNVTCLLGVPPDFTPGVSDRQGTPEIAPLMLGQIVSNTFWLYQTLFLFQSLRLTLNSAGRKLACVNASGWGLKPDSQLSCTGIPEADTKCRFQMKGVASYLLAIAGRVRPATEYLTVMVACGGASKGNASPLV